MFEFNLVQIKWYDSKWISLCIVETPDNWGALLHVCYLWTGEWEYDLLWFRFITRWIARKFIP